MLYSHGCVVYRTVKGSLALFIELSRKSRYVLSIGKAGIDTAQV